MFWPIEIQKTEVHGFQTIWTFSHKSLSKICAARPAQNQSSQAHCTNYSYYELSRIALSVHNMLVWQQFADLIFKPLIAEQVTRMGTTFALTSSYPLQRWKHGSSGLLAFQERAKSHWNHLASRSSEGCVWWVWSGSRLSISSDSDAEQAESGKVGLRLSCNTKWSKLITVRILEIQKMWPDVTRKNSEDPNKGKWLPCPW